MFNNQDCENLKKFMESEADFSFEAKCERCRKRDSEDCNMLKNRYSAEDSKVFRELWNNVTLVEEAGKTEYRSNTCTDMIHMRPLNQRTRIWRRQREEQTPSYEN